MTLQISTDHKAARTAATLTYASTGATTGNGGKIQFFASADWTGPVLAEVNLANPPGVITSGVIVLSQADVGGDLIALDGEATSAHWLRPDGDLVAKGSVSDEAGSGDFKIKGATGTQLYAGGYLILGLTAVS